MAIPTVNDILITDTGSEQVSVTDLKTYLQIEGAAYDGPLGIFITAARQMVERLANVSLVDKTIVLNITTVSAYYPFELPFPLLDTVTSVEWLPSCGCTNNVYETLVVGDDYTVNVGYISTIKADQYGQFKVTYNTTADTRSIWLQAIKAQAGWMYNNRDSKPGMYNNRDSKSGDIAPEVSALINTVSTPNY